MSASDCNQSILLLQATIQTRAALDIPCPKALPFQPFNVLLSDTQVIGGTNLPGIVVLFLGSH